MSQLMLITGFKDEAGGGSSWRFEESLKSFFPSQSEVWMDPSKKPRAVIFFEEKLELMNFQKQFKGNDIFRFSEAAESAHSVFVKTYGCLELDVKYKLKYFFTSSRYNGSPVLRVEQLNSDNFEIFFYNWDAVLKTCRQTWRVEEHILSVTPYFKCFKEPFEVQLQRLTHLDNVARLAETVDKEFAQQNKPVSSSSAVRNLNQAPIRNLPLQPSLAETKFAKEGQQSSPSQTSPPSQESGSPLINLPSLASISAFQFLGEAQTVEKNVPVFKKSCLPVEKRTDQKCAKPILEHTYILMLLHLLGFEETVQAHFDNTAVEIDVTTWEIEIIGPVSSLKIIQKFLAEEDEVDQAEAVEKFLAIKTTQQDLKKCVGAEDIHMVMITAKDKPHFKVQYGKDKTVLFHDFISSLVAAKECSRLPSEVAEEKKWIEFKKSFINLYSDKHIFVKNECVTLVYLAHNSQDIDFICSIINHAITQLKGNAVLGPKSDQSTSGSTVSVDEASEEYLTSVNSSQGSEGTYSKTKAITLVSQHGTLLWLLNILNFRNTVQEMNSNLVVDINEDEQTITVKGPQKDVQNLKSILMAIIKQFPLTMYEQELLSDAHVQEYLKVCLTESSCHIVLNSSSEMLVVYNNEGKEWHTTHLTNLIKIRECLRLPEKYHTTKGWNSLVASAKNSQSHLYLLAENDKTYLLLITISKTLPDLDSIVEEINETISALVSAPKVISETKSALSPTAKVFETKSALTLTPKVFETKSALSPTAKVFETKSALTPTLKVFETKSALTSTPEKEMIVDACSSDSPRDHTTLLEDKTETDKKPKHKKLIIICNSPVLPWLLNVLKFKKAVKEFGVHVTIDTETVVSISGPRSITKDLQKILITHNNQVGTRGCCCQTLFEDHCCKILSDPQVQEFLFSRLLSSRAHIVLGDNLDLFVEIKYEEKTYQISLKNFLRDFIRLKKCFNLPERFQATKEWETLVQKYRYHKQCYVHVTEDEVYLLTFALGHRSCDTGIIVQEINETISSFSSPVFSDYDMMDDVQRHDCFFECPEQKKLFCGRFLVKDFDQILAPYKDSYEARVEDVERGFRIHSASRTMNSKIMEDLKQILTRITENRRPLQFPHLPEFLTSSGSSLIEMVSNENKCHIELSDSNSGYSPSLPSSGNISSDSSKRLQYKVAMLESAKCNGFNVHFVQGDMQNLNLEMTVDLQPSNKDEVCRVKRLESSRKLAISLPRWPAADDFTLLDDLRGSFQNEVSLTLNQVKYIKATSIAFSTNHLKEAKEFSFPADVIARAIVEKLFEFFGSVPNFSKETSTLDIYICGKSDEAIFRAFAFFLKRKGAILGPVIQACWDKVCSEESEKYADYKSFQANGISIEMSSSFPSYKGKSACFYYPIHPTLEIRTCPAVNDFHFQEPGLKAFLTHQERENPDGILASEVLSMKGYPSGRVAFIYISPDWGMDSKKTIKVILDHCFNKTSDYEEVYIVPPGMQMVPKYPVAYLAQTWFKHLDNLLPNWRSNFQKKKITFVVQDITYRKAFEQELYKRSPKNVDKGYFGSLYSTVAGLFSSGDKKSSDQSKLPQSVTRTSQVPSTMVSFWCTSHRQFQEASQKLESELKKLMAKNTQEVKLSSDEANSVQHLMKEMGDPCALIALSEKIETFQGQGKKKKKKKHVGANQIKYIMKLQGLCMDYVNNCLHMLKLGSKVNSALSEMEVDTESDEEPETNVPSLSSENTSISKANQSQKETDSNVPHNKATDSKVPHCTTTSAGTSSHSLTQTATFKWQYDSNCKGIFSDIGCVGKDIEAAYCKEMQSPFKPPGTKFTKVNFTTFTAVTDKGEHGILRTEVFETTVGEVSVPASWTGTFKKCNLSILDQQKEQFQELQRELEGCLKSDKLDLIEVSQVQSKTLYTRFIQKKSQFREDGTILWHRASIDCKDQICRYGFHPRFSGMPEAKHLGDGVLFYKEPSKCLRQPLQEEEKICLFKCTVLLGRSGLGRHGLRCPSSGDSKSELFQSVDDGNGDYMIFSDAQAYPEYVLTLQKK